MKERGGRQQLFRALFLSIWSLDWQENVSECEYELCSFFTYSREICPSVFKIVSTMNFVEGGKRLKEKSICLRALHKSFENYKAVLLYST